MTNTRHKDSINSYTSTDDLIPRYSFEDLPSEKPVTLFDLVYGLIAFILGIFSGLIILAVNLLILLSPPILVGLGIYYLFFFNQW